MFIFACFPNPTSKASREKKTVSSLEHFTRRHTEYLYFFLKTHFSLTSLSDEELLVVGGVTHVLQHARQVHGQLRVPGLPLVRSEDLEENVQIVFLL